MTRIEKNKLKVSMRRMSISSIGLMILGALLAFGAFIGVLYTTQTVYESGSMIYTWLFVLGLTSVIAAVILSAKVMVGHKKITIYREELRLKRDGRYFERVRTLAKEGKIVEAFNYFELMKVSTVQNMTLGYLLNELYNKYKDSPENLKILGLINKYLNS